MVSPSYLETEAILRGVFKPLELKSLDNFPYNSIVCSLDLYIYPEMENYIGVEDNVTRSFLSILRNPLESPLLLLPIYLLFFKNSILDEDISISFYSSNKKL